MNSLASLAKLGVRLPRGGERRGGRRARHQFQPTLLERFEDRVVLNGDPTCVLITSVGSDTPENSATPAYSEAANAGIIRGRLDDLGLQDVTIGTPTWNAATGKFSVSIANKSGFDIEFNLEVYEHDGLVVQSIVNNGVADPGTQSLVASKVVVQSGESAVLTLYGKGCCEQFDLFVTGIDTAPSPGFEVIIPRDNFNAAGLVAAAVTSGYIDVNKDGIFDTTDIYFCPGSQGLTPGFWKQDQHQYAWDLTGFKRDDSFDVVFGLPVGTTGLTLQEALEQGGGIGSTAADSPALLRHAVAALLNAASDDLDFGVSVDQVKMIVQNAFATNADLEQTKDLLASWNEQGGSIPKPPKAPKAPKK